ncbi:MAG: DMT family transporter, partial [Verrucomicrobiae bacterium]|nr:DMT family transporter [Verrucomicrobiae bacterium]
TLLLHALKLLGAGRNAILGCLFSPFVILFSFLFLGERFSLLQFAGFLVILTGIILAVYRKPEDTITREDLIKGTFIGVLSVLCMALGMVTTKPLIAGASPIAVSCVRLVGGVSGMLLYVVATGQLPKAIRIFRGKLPWPFMITGAFFGSFLAVFTWILGFKYTTASIASILNQTSVIFILLLAAIFLKERLNFLKVTGALLGFVGVALILADA